MEDKDIYSLYEKLYFHEIDSREKLNARLNTPLTLIASFIGVLAFLLQNYAHQKFTIAEIIFLLLFLVAAIFLVISTYFFIMSWYGHTYSFLPDAKETEKHRQDLITIYKPYENGLQLASKYFSDSMISQYINCSSANTACNDKRSMNLHKTNRSLIITSLITFVAFLAFFLGDLDKSKIKKITEVSIVNPILSSEAICQTNPKIPNR